MKIEVVTKNVNDESMVREFVERKIKFALDRVNARVNRVVVRLDESANSDAFDGVCRIDVMLNPTGQIHVSANGISAFDSILQAARKMEHAIKHDMDRNRSSSRIRHQKSKQDFYSSLND